MSSLKNSTTIVSSDLYDRLLKAQTRYEKGQTSVRLLYAPDATPLHRDAALRILVGYGFDDDITLIPGDTQFVKEYYDRVSLYEHSED